MPADEYLRESQHIVDGLLRAYELYRPDGLPITFDLQIEAEVLGCELRWAEKEPPAVVSHPLVEGTLADLPPFDVSSGRFPLIAEATRRVKAEIGEQIAIYGLITGPFTLGLHLLGSDIFLRMFEDPDGVNEVGAFCVEVAKKVSDMYRDCGADIIAVVDPMTSQISPEHFEQFVTPHVNEIFDHIHVRGLFGSMFVCGDATRNLEAMCRTHCDNVSVDENISLEQLKSLGDQFGKSVGGNLKLTTVLLMGTETDAKLDAIRCIDTCGSEGFILAPGCDLPYDVPSENLQAIFEMVYDEYARDVARETLTATEADSYEDIQLPDYQAHRQVIVDVITLDSAACAPCQYMVDAVQRAAETAGGDIVVREHKIKEREGLGMMCKLAVSNIPSICIDGETEFASIIPDQDTLVNMLKERLAAKGG
jgi:uroporphyrinogen decarboxylase